MTPPPDPALPIPAQTADAVLAAQGVSADTGLSAAEAARRLAAVGPNRIAPRAPVRAPAVLWHQLKSPVVALLGVAAALALAAREIEEALAVGLVLALNTLIGFLTEMRALRSLAALRAFDLPRARVRRDGQDRVMPAEALVPGDIVLLEAGDAVPADLRIVESAGARADESALTGESVPVGKDAAPVEAADPGERRSMLFKGTALVAGSASGVVVATGPATELGAVAHLAATAGTGQSPIERKLAGLSAQLVRATLVLAALIVAVGVATAEDVLLLAKAAIALAVAAIPEGLPIVATLALARGMWRMARANALVERLSAVETLGATTVILTDKTGTLTENRMAVRRLWLPGGEAGAADAAAAPLLRIAVLCNDAALEAVGDEGAGDPMERALLRAGLQAGLRRATLLEAAPLLAKHPFDAVRRMMVTVHAAPEGAFFAVKGAPEAVLAACAQVCEDGRAQPLTPDVRAQWQARVAALAGQGLRVLACAAKTAPPEADPHAGFVLYGLVGLEDPPRPDVPPAIAACRAAGIRVVMVTGDHAVTAQSIGRALALDLAGGVVEGAGVAALIARGDGALTRAALFARVSPAQKLEIVRAFQAAGEIVAMTGDGVNDAPALRQADIGVAMGRRGTDVARQAAAMVLLDDAFPTIVAAIREGRVIFGNIRRFAAYLLACNLAEVLVVGLAVVAALPLPILPLQILYLNLVTDVFPAFALAFGDGEGDVLARPPRPPREPILGRPQWLRIAGQSVLMTAASLGALALASGPMGLSGPGTVTATFLTLGFAQLWQVFNMRAARAGLWVNEITRNRWIWAALALCAGLLALPPYLPGVAGVLGLVPPDRAMWALILGLSALPLLLWQVGALLRRRWGGRHGG